MARRVLFLTGGRMAVYHWEHGQLLEPLWFSADEDGLTEFSLYLDHAPRDPVYMLVDVVEEEFREESIPHVMGGDRRALLRTRLNRLFRDSTYSHAIVQGREREGRRDDQVLFAALIRPDLLSPWVGQIAKHKVPLAGIYSLPIVSQALIKTLPVDSDHALLVTLQSSGGLRQTYFRERQIKLSRLAFMPQVDPSGRASYVLGEVEKIRRYLNSLRQLPQESPLDVYVVGTGDLLADITRQSPDSLTTRHHLFELGEVAQKVGIKGDYESPYADRIFAHLLADKRPPNQYASSSQTRHFAMHRARVSLYAASVTLFVVSLFMSGTKFFEGVVAARDTASVRQAIEFYQERYRIARNRMPPTPAGPREIKTAVETATTLTEYKTTPLAMMAVLSEGLADFPRLKLDGIEWLASTDRDALVGGRGGERTRSSARGSEGPTDGDGAARLYQLANVRLRVVPFDGDYQGVLDLIGEFTDTLRVLPNVEDVQVIKFPIELEGAISVPDAKSSTDVAPFELRVVIRDKEKDRESG